MNKIFLAILLFSTLGCQTLQSPLTAREPNATAAAEWHQLDTEAPETFLQGDSERTLKENRRKLGILNQCQVLLYSEEGQALERDLLFIRLLNWPKDRLLKEYLRSIPKRNLDCLIDRSFDLGV